MTKSAKKASTLPTARNRSVGGGSGGAATEDGGDEFVPVPPPEQGEDIPVPPLNGVPPPLPPVDEDTLMGVDSQANEDKVAASASTTAATANTTATTATTETPLYVATAAALVDPSIAAAAAATATSNNDKIITDGTTTTTENTTTTTHNNAPPIDALANAAIEAAEADRIAKLKATNNDDEDDDDAEMKPANATATTSNNSIITPVLVNIASTYKTTDIEFEYIETLYKNNQTVEAKQTTQEIEECENQIKEIVEKINHAEDIEQIENLSSEAARLEAHSKKLKDECVEMNEGVSKIKRTRDMAKLASEYWLKEKRDFKRFGEWKIILKKIDTVCPVLAAEDDLLSKGKNENAGSGGGSGGVSFYPNPTNAQEIQEMYQPSNKQSVPAPRKAKTTKAKEDRLRQRRDWKYIPEATYKFYLQGGQKGSESLEGHGFEWRNGYIYCNVCDSFLKRPVDMKQHARSARHERRLKDFKENQGKGNDEIENIFQRILNDEGTKNNEDTSKPAAEATTTETSTDADKDGSTENATEGDAEGVESTKSESTPASNSMAQEATEYWLNHKQDIKKFLEWKMMQKMVTRVLPPDDQVKVDQSNSNMEEVEIASRMVEGFHQPDMDQSINPPPTKRLHSVPNPKTPEAKRQRTKVAKDNRQRQERDWKFIPESTFKFYLQGGKFQNESLEGNGIEWRDGYIYCTLCEVYIKRAVDMKQHCKSGRHQNKLKDLLKKHDVPDGGDKQGASSVHV